MYDSIMLTVIALLLLWIALGLQVIAASIRLVGTLFRPSPRSIRAIERTTIPWIAKVVVVKVVTYSAVKYFTKKMR